MGKKVKIPAMDVSQMVCGREITRVPRHRFQLSLTGRQLLECLDDGLQFEVKTFDWQSRTGEQRNFGEIRPAKIAKFIECGYPIDTSCTFSTPENLNVIEFDSISKTARRFGHVIWDVDNIISVTDGWNRWNGFLTAAKQGSPEALDCFLTAILAVRDPIERLITFTVDACTAKRQTGNLLTWQKAQLKRVLPECMFNCLPAEISKNTNNLIEACDVVEYLYSTEVIGDVNNPLYSRITMPNTSYKKASDHLSCNGMSEVVRALFPKKVKMPKTTEGMSKAIASYFRAWITLVPAAVDDKENCGLLKAHAGSIALFHLLKLCYQYNEEIADKVPTVREWVALLRRCGPYAEAAYWQTANNNGYNATGGLHGKGASLKLARRMHQTMNPSAAA